MTDHRPAAGFVVGFVGVPGDRTFYFQLESEEGALWYLLEKLQVAGFAAEGARLLAEAGLTGVGRHLELGPLLEPDAVEFRIGAMHIAYVEEEGLMVLTLQATDEAIQPVSYSLTAAQVDAAARIATEAVSAGRPRCPQCGLAMDPDGHACPTTNGDLRNHRP